MTTLRDEIKRGNVWIPGSRRYGKLDDFFLPEATWTAQRADFFRKAGLPAASAAVAPFLTTRLDAAYDRLLATLPSNAYVTVEDKRLLACGPRNHFYRAVRELGRLYKTLFILDYLSDPTLRRRVRRGLLKGEQLHALARQVHYGHQGQTDGRDFQQQMSRASCLVLILASIIYWQIQEI